MAQIKHAVLLRFKSSTTPAKVGEIFEALRGLGDKIPGILDFSGGAYSSGEGLNKGFTHGFIMTFVDAKARDVYLPHPDHEVVKQMIFPELDGGLDGVVAFDWEA
ncbi:MAG: Dabb family protein [Phycisphaerae bacterium]|nr:Dabb family protein [Phycisphaerae bacterium]